METVIGAFDSRETAQRAVDHLEQAGFSREDVHVQEGHTENGELQEHGQRAGAGNEHGMFASISHFFTTLFGEDSPAGHAGTYSEAVRRGSSVVVVDARDEQQAGEASALLHELGAIDIDERASQWRAGGWAGSGPVQAAPAMPVTAAKETAANEGVLDVVQEELKVGKRAVDRGGVRVIQRVTQQPVREILRLREERAVVERRPADRVATADDLSTFREGTLEVRETAEEAVVAKTARVVEEVRVGKEVKEREETIEETLRRKDVDIERIEGTTSSSPHEDRAYASDRAAVEGKGRTGDSRPS